MELSSENEMNFTCKWTEPEVLSLRDITQTQKDKCHTLCINGMVILTLQRCICKLVYS